MYILYYIIIIIIIIIIIGPNYGVCFLLVLYTFIPAMYGKLEDGLLGLMDRGKLEDV